MKPEEYVFGRPTEYRPEFCKMLAEHQAKGFSFESFGGVVMASSTTLYRWIDDYPDFREARDVGINTSRLFWEKLGVAGVSGRFKKFSATGWAFNMKNRFKWTDRAEFRIEAEKLEAITVKLPRLGATEVMRLKKAERLRNEAKNKVLEHDA